MSSQAAFIAIRLKEAERIASYVKEHVLPKRAIEEIKFDEEDLEIAYQKLDELMMINADVSVGSAIAQIQARIEMAQTALDVEMRREAIVLEREDHIMISLEGYHGN